MDEGREASQVRIDRAILPPHVARDFTVYSIRDCAGRVVFYSKDVVDISLYVGSRMEH